MYPTLSDLISDIFGIYIPLPVQSFGFFMAISLFAGGYVMLLELKRKESTGLLHPFRQKIVKGERAKPSELFLQGIIGFILGFKGFEAVFHYSDFVENPQNFVLSARGNILGGLIIAGLFTWLRYREKEKEKLEKPVVTEITVRPHQLAWNILLIAALFGLLGAKIFHNLENIDELISDPLGSIFSFSGLTFYGGLICGAAAVYYYAHRHGINWVVMSDTAAPGLILSYAIGRIGCHIAGDGDWGIPNDNPLPAWLSFLPSWLWAYDYPNNVLGISLKEDFEQMGLASLTGNAYPTPLYETLIGLLIFAALWILRKKITTGGFLFSIYLILTSIERFLIELMRVNVKYTVGTFAFTQAELLSVIMVLLGISGLFYFNRKGKSI
ncbi:MAG: prolipoprotein diacylglyceryl transferase [Bacteroidetes bacterium]|nr:prolipoprotein diacylglyceryl transferase [Bacteroidota bacterium]